MNSRLAIFSEFLIKVCIFIQWWFVIILEEIETEMIALHSLFVEAFIIPNH